MKKAAVLLGLTAMASGVAVAQDDDHGRIPSLDHVFVIMMENHYIDQVLGQTFTPFTNSYAASANLAKNYWAVGHPSLTNYLEIVGGSNFGIQNDNSPDWHNTNCVSTLQVPVDESSAPVTCPISGSGIDAATPALDTTNEGTPTEPIHNIPVPAAKTVGVNIADQLVEHGMTWKSYQENLPPYGADKVNNSDGLVSDVTASEPGMPKLYAVKHNPFAYFANVQAGTNPALSLKQIVDFHQLFADLNSGNVPNLAFIAPDQCHDQHGRGSSEMGTGCSVDQNAIASGDAALSVLIKAIHNSPAWKQGRTAIVTVWDENDYSSLPNNVVAIVDTNYGTHGKTSNVMYNHFSLLKSLEDGFGLPHINHAADRNVKAMSDLFAAH
ncbi:phosphoesterase [Acidobacteria bacterium AB60]|nr:phosphoesterase [Acidobacteria bacterium AB60]